MKKRVSVEIDQALFGAMATYINTPIGKGKKLIKSDNFPALIYNKTEAISKKEDKTISAIIRDALLYQLAVMQVLTRTAGKNIFPKCSAAAFMVQAAELYTAHRTGDEREEWLDSFLK